MESARSTKRPFGCLCRVDMLVDPYKWREQTVFRAGEGNPYNPRSVSKKGVIPGGND